MFMTMVALAMTLTQKAWAAPEDALPWDAVARSSEPLVVTDFEWVNTEPHTHGGRRDDSNARLRIKPTRGCVGNVCGRLNVVTTLDVTRVRNECYDSYICVQTATLGLGAMGVGGLYGALSLAFGTRNEKIINGGIVLAGAGLYAGSTLPPKRKERLQILAYASEHMNALFRRTYVQEREAYLHLRDHFAACVNGSDAPLTVSVEDRKAARSRCDIYKKELGRTPVLERAFAEASMEVRGAIASWHASPLIDRLASGDYLGFYQDRANLFLDSLPAPVAQDVCDRVRDATGGKAIADALLRKKLSAWASETCPGVE